MCVAEGCLSKGFVISEKMLRTQKLIPILYDYKVFYIFLLRLREVLALLLGHVQLSATPWTVACQGPLFMGFPRQEYWSGLPFPFPGDLPDPGIEPTSPALWASLIVQLVKNPPVMQETPV